MTAIEQNLNAVRRELGAKICLVAVSKNHPVEVIMEAYQAGQRIFGENRVQEILAKQPLLPSDIQWHMIGHLQTNKARYLAPFISMIHSVDSWKLLLEVSLQALRNNRVIDCLLQVYIATEETKFGLDREELYHLLTSLKQDPLPGIRVRGLMGMASFSEDIDLIRREFRSLKSVFDSVKVEFFSKDPDFNELSIGMSSDYLIAAGEGSTMVRIGTKIFGSR